MWLPYLEGEHGFGTLWRPIVRGMVLTEQAIRAEHPHAQFMQVDASTLMLVNAPDDQGLVERAAFINEQLFSSYDALLGKIDGRHKLMGYLQEHGVTDAELDWHQANRGSFDYMGVNFYPHPGCRALQGLCGKLGSGPGQRVIRPFWWISHNLSTATSQQRGTTLEVRPQAG